MKQTEVSKIQEHFWLLNELSPNSPVYDIFGTFRIDGIPSATFLEQAINIIISRHEGFRASFHQEGMKVVQDIADPGQYHIPVITVSIDRAYNENETQKELEDEVNIATNPSKPPLIRAKLFIYTNNVSVLLLNFHHIIYDARSESIFSNELFELYRMLEKGEKPELENVPYQYSDYIEEINKWYKTDEYKKMLNGWAEEFPEQITKLELPVDFSVPPHIPPDGTIIFFNIAKDVVSRVSKYASSNDTNSFRLFLAAYAVLLNKLTGKETIYIGVPLTNRARPVSKYTAGCFINSLPVTISFEGEPTCKEILSRVKNAIAHNQALQEIPLLELVSCIKADRSSTNSFFQTGFTFRPPMTLRLEGFKIKPFEVKHKGSQMDLFFSLIDRGDWFECFAEYNALLFKEETIKRWINIYQTIIEEFIQEPDRSLSSINITPADEEEKLTLWNATDSYYEKDLCLHRKLENQALVNPDLIALHWEDKKLTYKELNQNANKLAHYLVSKGIVADDFVPICIGRSLEMMIGIYAILKAGGAYVPVDPNAPTDRLKSILDDAKPKLILTTKKDSTNLPSGNYETIYLDTILTDPFSSDDSNPVVTVNSHNLAYVIYTSGSTGIPKGVMIEHHSVLNRLGWMQEAYPLTTSDVLIQKTPVTFDVSVWELFWWSFAGASLVVLSPGAEKEPEKLTEAIRSFKVSVIHFVPSMFGVFLSFLGTLKEQDKIKSLKNIFLSGEALPPNMINDFNGIMKGYSSPELINLYGPTEATVDVSYYHCPKDRLIDTMYIGKPVSNTKLLILDKNGKIQPVGIPGELVITGVNLSRGYLNRDELNKEKFINVRYFDGSILRAYRTGDLAKWTDAGEIFYIGRLDNQVKIRGFRIELGDIEAKIHEHPSVHNCAVIVAEDTEPKSLIAYICPKPGAEIEAEDMRRFLSSKLPDYMVPPHFVFIDNLPLTSSGKLNRKALPKPERARSETAIVLPVNNCERQLMGLWRDLLKIDSISINDNFFDIGGNSLLAINLATLISKEFNVVFNTIFLFEYPSIKSQSDYITSKIGNETVPENNEFDEKMRRRKDVNFRKIR